MAASSQSPRLPADVGSQVGEGSTPAPAFLQGAAAAPEQANLPQAREGQTDRCVSVPAGASHDHDGALREPRRWRIEFPAGMELLTSNSSKNWGRHHRIGTEIKNTAITLCRYLKIPRLDRVSIVAEYQPPAKGRSPVREAHNLGPTAKAGIDGLVKAGVLRDDADRYVADVTFQPGPKVPLGRFVLILTEINEERP